MSLSHLLSPFDVYQVLAAAVTGVTLICGEWPATARSWSCRTVANTLSIGFGVRRWSRTLAGSQDGPRRYGPSPAQWPPSRLCPVLLAGACHRRHGGVAVRRCPDLAQGRLAGRSAPSCPTAWRSQIRMYSVFGSVRAWRETLSTQIVAENRAKRSRRCPRVEPAWPSSRSHAITNGDRFGYPRPAVPRLPPPSRP